MAGRRRFIHSTDAAAHSWCALNVGPSPGDGRRWQQRRHGTCFGTKNEDVRRRKKQQHGRRDDVHINRKRITSFLILETIYWWTVFYFFLNFGWGVHRHYKEYISLNFSLFKHPECLKYLECLPQADRRDNIVRPLWRAFRSWEPVDWDIPNVGIQFCRICICNWRNPLVQMVPSLDAKSFRVGNI
jgi:hypothetical protein